MSITLDGNTYNTHLERYRHNRHGFHNTFTGLLGDPIHIEANAFRHTWKLTLICTKSQVQTLVDTYGKTTPASNKLVFTDEEGVTYDPAAGSSTATYIYNTGVWFEGELDPQPMTAKGWSLYNRFTVDITLIGVEKVLGNYYNPST